ncbi:MAG: C2 family cysteine protease [Brachybacterium sp.]|nr:C2 family cysteine protease [Brachybacterium sp.]
MTMWGADTEALMALARQVRDRHLHVAERADAVRTSVAATTWTGRDADDFRSRGDQCSSEMLLVSDHLHSVASHLALQAAEQDAASDPDGRIDSAAYDGLIGGNISWSDAINFFERVADPFRDRVEAGSPGSPLGERYVDRHPEWDPSDVPLDVQAIRDAQVQQGSLGDCWYLAALMAVQGTEPQLLANNISSNDTGGWDVRLYIDGQWETVSVAPEDLGTRGAKSAGSGGYNEGTIGFASIYEQAMINAVDGRPSAVSADTPQAGLEMITGRSAQEYDTWGQPDFDTYRQAIDEGRPITVMTDPIAPIGPASDDLVAAHVYQVSGYDESTGELILTNPHGPHASSAYEVRVDPNDRRFATDIFMTGIGASNDG